MSDQYSPAWFPYKSGQTRFIRPVSWIPLLFFLHLCSQSVIAQILPLSARPNDAPTGNQIIQDISSLTREIREDSLYRQIMSGNVPDFMRDLVAVTSSGTVNGALRSIRYYVTPDYLSVGSNDDYFLTPMTPILAQRIADALHCTLPTRKMVNDIYLTAPLKLAPAPIAPSADMITVPVFARHDSMVWAQREPQRVLFPLGTLVGGTKKDVVISNKIRNDLKAGVPRPVVIYGWHQLNGIPIQPIYNGHGETYADYSHGIRLVQEAVELDGSPTTVSAIVRDPALSVILSDEGPITIPRYGDPPAGVDEKSRGRPEGSMMFQNYPNPFNPTTVISYELSKASEVKLVVYDVLGRELSVLVDERVGAGHHEVTFSAAGWRPGSLPASANEKDGQRLASGIYFYKLQTGGFVQTKKMLLLD
jgi:hypothetical protein